MSEFAYGHTAASRSARPVERRSTDETLTTAMNVVIALALLLFLLPVMIAVAIAVYAQDGGPILFAHRRIGLNGRIFPCLKFRSMAVDAEARLAELLASDPGARAEWDRDHKLRRDPRVTPLGAFLRKTSLDELPQLINVLRGDMSLVGPRPERPYFVDQLAREIPYYAVRHSVKPGVTGWAQVRYHYSASLDDAIQKLQYDLYYVKNHTLFLDIVVLFETVGVVLTAEGAH